MQTATTASSEATPADLFGRLRQGARNVAGVSYQIGLSAALLVRSGMGGWPDITAVRPEGFEDIDCRLEDGGWLFVQSKERSPGNALGASGVAEAIRHALELRSVTADDGPRRVAVVTNERFASNVPVTGWSSTLSGQLGLDNLRAALIAQGMDAAETEHALSLTSTVIVPDPLQPGIVRGVLDGYGVADIVARAVHAHLVHELARMAGEQRSRELHDAFVFERTRIDRLVEDVQRATDLTRLSRAVDAGVCEFADFAHGTPDDLTTFFSGVAVLPTHIASGLDVLRVSETERALEALSRSRQALIVGPSGTGKSALLWRTASMIADGSRVIRVTRVSSDSDVALLVDHVAALAPDASRPVIVCIDDLGRARTSAWPAARDELLAMTGVSVIGGCRQEDLTPEIGRRAALVDSRLDGASAHAVIQAMQTSGISLAVEPEEAIDRGNGLMMEMIAFATTGRHLNEVLSDQVAMLSTRDVLAVEALRYIATLHTLGHALPAEHLGRMCTQDGDLSHSLRLLQDEHLIAIEDATAWRALHDLRAEVLVEVLHASPPPTLGATYARAIAGVQPRLRPELVRRAATRLTRRSSSALGLSRELGALADMIRDQVRREIDHPSEATAGRVAEWVQVAERLDALSYVHAALRVVSNSVPDTADPTDVLLLAYSHQASDVLAELDLLRDIRDLAARLPQWSPSSVETVLIALDPGGVDTAFVTADLESAIALAEAIEGRIPVSAATVARVLESHPVEPGSLRSVGLRAQLVAALFSANDPAPEEVDGLFGAVASRATLAVAADPSGYEAVVTTIAATALPESRSALVRPPRSEIATVATAKAFARADPNYESDSYPDQPGTNAASVNAQAVRFVRRLFDMCPELDLVTVDVVQAHGETDMMGVPSDGHKSIRAGVVPRAVEQRRNIAVQAAAMSTRNNERWSDRCREQAALANDLATLLNELPRRFAPNDHAARRGDWSHRVRQVAARAARMPGIPAPRPFLDEVATLLGSNAADLEQRVRESDKARKFYDAVTGSLLQVVQSGFDQHAVHGAGLRLAAALKLFDEAETGPQLPVYAAIGPTLPSALRDSVLVASRMLTCFERLPAGALRVSSVGDRALTNALDQLAIGQAAATADAVMAQLEAAGVSDVTVATYEAAEPVPAWNHLGVSVAVVLDDWAATERALREWDVHARTEAGFDSVVVASARDGGLAIPIGLVLFGSGSRGTPATDEYLQLARVVHALDEVPHVYRARMGTYLDQLISLSQAKNLRLHRPGHWPAIPDPPPLPAPLTVSEDDPAAWSAAVERAAALATEVGADDTRGAQLAVDLARLDMYQTGSAHAQLASLVLEVGFLTLEADVDIARAH
ncbi:hypothetical protein GCM10009571_09950 [Agromyces luteolus]